jgi:hypothetical protein
MAVDALALKTGGCELSLGNIVHGDGRRMLKGER